VAIWRKNKGLPRSLFMLTKVSGIALLLISAMFAQNPENPAPRAPAANPESFYIAALDRGAWLIVDVQPLSPSDSKVRFIQVYPACATYHVQEDDYVFENVSVKELAGNTDICSSEEVLARRIKGFKLKQEDDAWDLGIEAQCSAGKVVHHLSTPESLRFAALEAKAPRIAALWTLSGDISKRYKESSGQDLAIYDSPRWQGIRLEKRSLSEQGAIDIRGGNYDLAMPEIPEYLQLDGQSKLSQMLPEPEEAASSEENVGIIENASQLGLEKSESTTVPYPQMALIAHIDGDLSMQVYIDAESGSVTKTITVSGHPLMARSADEAIRKWRFVHPYSGQNPLPVVIHYKAHCPPIVEATTTTGTEKSHKRSRKKGAKK
jgi:hypothetical protein